MPSQVIKLIYLLIRKNPQFLSAKHMSFFWSRPFVSFAVEEIVKNIQDFEGLEALRLEGNTVGVEAAQAIAKALETKNELKVIFCFCFSMV